MCCLGPRRCPLKLCTARLSADDVLIVYVFVLCTWYIQSTVRVSVVGIVTGRIGCIGGTRNAHTPRNMLIFRAYGLVIAYTG